MKKVVKNSMIVAVMTLAMMSCKKEDVGSKLVSGAFNGTVTAAVENGAAYNDQISKVIAVIDARIVNNEFHGTSAGQSSYANGGFSISLPAEVPDEFLVNIEDFFTDVLQVSGKLKYSVTGARMNYVDFVGFLNDYYVDFFNYYKRGDKPVICFCVYADMDVDVTGGTNISVSLRQGWNRIYHTDGKSISTKAPDGMKWYLNRDK
jgi:hypothetical protein